MRSRLNDLRRFAVETTSSLDVFMIELPRLVENRLGESATREIAVWKPHDADARGLPLLICLASYLNTGPSLVGWRGFGETIPERLDRLYEEGKLLPAIVVFIDSYNRLGGTQFVNSPIIGRWSDALADDVVPQIEMRYGCGGPGKRGLFGHSSGGYGALYNLSHRSDVWSAAASHAGDCGFELVYRNELPKTLRVLATYDFDLEAFLSEFWQQEKPKGEQISALMMIAMAASYDLSDDINDYLGIRLPVTSDTCEFIPERWDQWLSFDPLSFVPTKIDSLANAKALYMDCGRQDEYNILYGTRRVSQFLSNSGIKHSFQEFDGGHGTIGPRYEVSLPLLVTALS